MVTYLNSQPAKRSMSNIISSLNYCGTAPKINYSNIFRHRRVLIFRHSTWQWSIVGCLGERKKITSWKFDLILSIKCERKVNEYDRRKRNNKPARTILNTICGTRKSTRHWRDSTRIFYRFERQNILNKKSIESRPESFFFPRPLFFISFNHQLARLVLRFAV